MACSCWRSCPQLGVFSLSGRIDAPETEPTITPAANKKPIIPRIPNPFFVHRVDNPVIFSRVLSWSPHQALKKLSEELNCELRAKLLDEGTKKGTVGNQSGNVFRSPVLGSQSAGPVRLPDPGRFTGPGQGTEDRGPGQGTEDRGPGTENRFSTSIFQNRDTHKSRADHPSDVGVRPSLQFCVWVCNPGDIPLAAPVR